MAPAFTQTNRLLEVTSPLGKDTLLALGLHGSEGLSQLYRFTVDVMAVRTTAVPFDALLGQTMGVHLQLPNRQHRHFHGLCVQLSQSPSDNEFAYFQLEIVPKVWLLTKKAQSRIFQQIAVPDILKKVFAGFDVEYHLPGKYEPRDYCVQYRETDFNFACRLMEEEGIYYFFKHEANKHTLVLGDAPQFHPPVPGATEVLYRSLERGMAGEEDCITELLRVQAQTSGKFTLRDHTFELVPDTHDVNQAQQPLPDSVTVGKVAHKLRVGDTSRLEVYDWPGEYAQRFDGMDTGGAPAAGEIPKVAPDGDRTVKLRVEAEASTAVRIQGGGSARQLVAGHHFSITTRPADVRATSVKAEGKYVLTTVHHAITAGGGGYTSGGGEAGYTNTFTAIPADLPFRPQRLTPKPVVQGTQTAQVVGPAGEEIFTDKYGRIKVHFHWDRDQPVKSASSSCWIRVAQMSAGRQWGSFSLPRVGQEVLVAFEEGDADRPICVGCVFNVDQAQMYKLPDEKTKTYHRTNSTPGGVGYNEVRIEDKAGAEQVYVHAQKNMDERVRNDRMERIGNDRHLRVGFYLPNDHKGDLGGEVKQGNQYEEVAVDQHLKVHNNKDEQVGGDMKLLVGGIGSGPNPGKGNQDIVIKANKHELIEGTSDLHVKGEVREKFDSEYHLHVLKPALSKYDEYVEVKVQNGLYTQIGDTNALKVDGKMGTQVSQEYHLRIGSNRLEEVGGKVSLTCGDYHEKSGAMHNVEAGQQIHLKAGATIVLEAPQICLKGAGGFVTVGPAGVAIQGMMVLINSGGAAVPGSGAQPSTPATIRDLDNPKDAEDAAQAKPIKPLDADHSKTGAKSN